MTYTEIMAYLRELNAVSLILRFVLAALCGGLIGATRGKGQHAAGLRTYLLVCVGAASIVMVSQFYAVNMGRGGDAMRMPAQVISGIGFLGAGSIIVTGKKRVSGLTTAAGLWASACMGIACGAGFYEGAIIMFVLIYFALVTLVKLDTNWIRTCRLMTVFIELDRSARLSALLCGLSEIGFEIYDIEQFGAAGDDYCNYMADIGIPKKSNLKGNVVELIKTIPGVNYAEEIDIN